MSKRSLLELLADMSAVVEGNPAKAMRMAADEIVSLREQVEKLTKERDDLHRAFNQPVPRSEWEKMQEQLAALAEQNEKQRAFLEFAWKGIPMNEYAFKILEHVMNLPNLATPLLNRLKAEAYREAAEICEKQGDRARTSTGAARALACEEAIRAKADELEKQS